MVQRSNPLPKLAPQLQTSNCLRFLRCSRQNLAVAIAIAIAIAKPEHDPLVIESWPNRVAILIPMNARWDSCFTPRTDV
ncbi:hypothetical protein K469DRAFT_720571 [Zopfia rhizophila CBS 207.26]|uniref:Uncharacterized protein n=1 Tax=Zopfia rhizophila CBS 207.26 TaxID=1314779 RepID=A0A6A6EKF6_9PEZI|nr:hypothetical protein K469DRAFT_720571 [Zopfia rhizophila CBS 207.26]